jgi:hypothetical protein
MSQAVFFANSFICTELHSSKGSMYEQILSDHGCLCLLTSCCRCKKVYTFYKFEKNLFLEKKRNVQRYMYIFFFLAHAFQNPTLFIRLKLNTQPNHSNKSYRRWVNGNAIFVFILKIITASHSGMARASLSV